MGSPPRVRGTAPQRHDRKSRIRITPACAGNRFLSVTDKTLNRDHPRVCGEQSNTYTADVPEPGSPPRVRGTGKVVYFGCMAIRITPACAGNSCFTEPIKIMKWDHPRVCGEQTVPSRQGTPKIGSPPRVRGTGGQAAAGGGAGRITPACAGNRRNICLCQPGQRDHPRVCGEQSLPAEAILFTVGSPPRVRGTASIRY